jgi:hypothetical protein
VNERKHKNAKNNVLVMAKAAVKKVADLFAPDMQLAFAA